MFRFMLIDYQNTLLPVLEANLCLVLVEANKGKNNQAHGPLCTLSIFLTAMTKCTAEALTSSCMSVLLSVMGKKKKKAHLFIPVTFYLPQGKLTTVVHFDSQLRGNY